jgi:hypothetical protein
MLVSKAASQPYEIEEMYRKYAKALDGGKLDSSMLSNGMVLAGDDETEAKSEWPDEQQNAEWDEQRNDGTDKDSYGASVN